MVKLLASLVCYVACTAICHGQGKFAGGPGRGDADLVVPMWSAGDAPLAYPNPARCGQAVRLAPEGVPFEVYSTNGQKLKNSYLVYWPLTTGVYLLKTNTKWLKLVVY